MKLILLLVLISLQSGAYASEKCDGPVEVCHMRWLMDDLDKKLNVQYRKVIGIYKKNNESENVNLLVEAQRAWIQYRDKVCEFENVAFGGANSISWGRCIARITEARLGELKEIERLLL